MRYFLSGRFPSVRSILLVESGSRGILDRLPSHFRQVWGDTVQIDLLTCFSGLPEGFGATTRVYSVLDYRDRPARRKLFRQLSHNRYDLVGMVCSDEPLMTKWKWALALRMRGKVLVINEYGDYFPLDIRHLGTLAQFVQVRAGLGGAGTVRTLARVISFPFTLLYLILYATTVHTRRALRRG